MSDKTPLLADFKPSGRYVMEDLHKVGGTPAVMKRLLEAGLLHGDCITVTGRTLAENLAELPGLAAGPAGRARALRSHQGDGPHPDPARQPRAGGLGGEAHRQGRPLLQRPGAGVRLRGGHDRGGGARRDPGRAR